LALIVSVPNQARHWKDTMFECEEHHGQCEEVVLRIPLIDERLEAKLLK